MSDSDRVLSALDDVVTDLLHARSQVLISAAYAENGESEILLLSNDIRLATEKAMDIRDKWLPNYREKIDALRDDAADAKRDEI